MSIKNIPLPGKPGNRHDAALLARMDADGKDYLYDMIGVKIALRHWHPLPYGS